MDNLIKVVYVMGVFRSGSTIFDILLGNLPEVISVGELVNVQKYAWLNKDYCSCGARGDECEFWSKVRDRWISENVLSIEQYIQLQQKFERFRYWPFLFFSKAFNAKEFKLYTAGLTSLYRCIKKESGSKIIVDSSKNPARALALSMMPDINLHLIHLVRDGRGVAWSCLKKFEIDVKQGLQIKIKPVSVVKTSIRWFSINASSSLVSSIIKKNVVRIRYEDVVENTQKTFDLLRTFLSVSVDELLEKIENESELNIGHTVAGNRVRMSKKIILKPDYEWHEKLTRSDNKKFWLVAGLLAKLYGYKKYSSIIKSR